MTTKIDTSTIDESYPVAGQDNDTAGFRNNFEQINIQLNRAGNEITELQNCAVLTGTIDNNSLPTTNNLRGSTIINGTYNAFYASSFQLTDEDTNTSGAIEINVSLGNSQAITLKVDTRLIFKNWPSIGMYAQPYASVRVHLSLHPDATQSVVDILGISTNNRPNADARYKEIDFPALHVSKNSIQVFDIWSYNSGNTFFLKYVGEFYASAGD